MTREYEFYRKHCVEECYVFDPDENVLDGWLRSGDTLEPIESANSWTSPRLGIHFQFDNSELHITGPDGKPFVSMAEMGQELENTAEERDAELQRADVERLARLQGQARADAATLRADSLAAKLRELGVVDPE